MFLNTLNHFNYHLTYRNLLKAAYQLQPRSSNSLLKNFTSNPKEHSDEDSIKECIKESFRENGGGEAVNEPIKPVQPKEPLSQSFNPAQSASSSSPDKLTSYIEQIRECKKAARSTYLFIFKDVDRRNPIKLPGELNARNYDYFNFRSKNMCLIDLECGKPTVDSIFQNGDEQQLGDSKFYHVKGPFLSSKLVQSEDGEKIKFFNYRVEDSVQLKNLKSLPDAGDQLNYLLENTEITSLERRIKSTLINYLEENICCGVFDNFELIPFGSSFAGLGVCGSDLDLLLIPKPLSLKRNGAELNEFIAKNSLTYLYKQQSLHDKRSVNSCLKLINQILRLLPGIEVEMHITNAAVPIIKLNCPVVQVLMDISMSLTAQNNGVILMSQALYSYNELFPILRKLYVVLRLWGHNVNVIRTQPGNHLKNFTFLMLLISFMQNRHQALLPSMKAIFNNDLAQIDEYQENNQQVDLFELIPEFFEYLTQANFLRNAIDLYEGKLSRNVGAQPMFIKNPFDPENPNMTKNMLTKNVIMLKRVAMSSLKIYERHDLSTLFDQPFSVPSVN